MTNCCTTETCKPEEAACGSMNKSMVAGVFAGIGGGIVFGMLMGMMGMLPMVSMLIGQNSTVIGFFVHMVISAIIGGTFGILAYRLTNKSKVILAGAGYGIVWWVLGALILMPLMLGMTQMVLVIGTPQLMSMMGHLIFGVVMGLLFIPIRDRT